MHENRSKKKKLKNEWFLVEILVEKKVNSIILSTKRSVKPRIYCDYTNFIGLN